MEQFAHGCPDNVTIHLTFRELQTLHATIARFGVRVAGSGENALSICDILPAPHHDNTEMNVNIIE